MDLKHIPNQYRPIPFWSWNEKLDERETRRQIEKMDEAGIGGFFMHARGGLQTEYMSDEWFSNVAASIDEAKKRGMRAWAYDENGWPSGFGSGIVNGRGVAYQQKYLRFEKGEGHTERTIFVRRYYYFDSCQEIGRKLGMTRGTVNTRLHRLRECLRKQLEKEGYLYE